MPFFQSTDNIKQKTKLSQFGFISQALLVLLLLAGVGVGTYLVQQRTNILPKAAPNSSEQWVWCSESKDIEYCKGLGFQGGCIIFTSANNLRTCLYSDSQTECVQVAKDECKANNQNCRPINQGVPSLIGHECYGTLTAVVPPPGPIGPAEDFCSSFIGCNYKSYNGKCYVGGESADGGPLSCVRVYDICIGKPAIMRDGSRKTFGEEVNCDDTFPPTACGDLTLCVYRFEGKCYTGSKNGNSCNSSRGCKSKDYNLPGQQGTFKLNQEVSCDLLATNPPALDPNPPADTVPAGATEASANTCDFNGTGYPAGSKRYECSNTQRPCAADAGVGVPFVCNLDGSWGNANEAGECTTECKVTKNTADNRPNTNLPSADDFCGMDTNGVPIPCYKLGVFDAESLANTKEAASVASRNYQTYTKVLGEIKDYIGDLEAKVAEKNADLSAKAQACITQ